MAKKAAVRWDSMDKSDTPLEKLVLQFQAFNRAEGKSPDTIDWYETSLHLFLEYLPSQSIQPILSGVDVDTVRTYILNLQKRQRYADHPIAKNRDRLLSPVTIQCYIRAIKAFFNWLYREGYTDANRLERLKVPKAPKRLMEPLTESEIGLILSCIDSQTDWGARDSTILLVFLDTGLRLSELVTMTTRDLHLEEGYVKVMGKGQKERVVPFGSAAQRALLKYVYHFRPEPLRDERVFLNLDGTPISGNAIQLMIQRLRKASGIARLHPHLLRHTFAVNYLMNGGDVFTLQQILGHTTLEMVRHYVNLANVHVMTQHQRFSPVDRMNLRQVNRATALSGKGRARKEFAMRGGILEKRWGEPSIVARH